MSIMMCSKMSVSPAGVQPSSESPLSPPRPPTTLPLRTIPGSHGWPLLGPISDRLDYFWFQGPETFFRKRIDKYKSTVFRTNVPPSFPFFTKVNPNVVAVLDTKSFAHLFDMDIVEKRNVLVGDFMPSVKFTGDIRVCAYLDTAEPQHSKSKLNFPNLYMVSFSCLRSFYGERISKPLRFRVLEGRCQTKKGTTGTIKIVGGPIVFRTMESVADS